MTPGAPRRPSGAWRSAGLLTRVVDAGDSRQRQLTPAARGTELLADVETIYAELEQEWAAVIGATALDQTRRRLIRALRAVHGGELPTIRPPA